MKNISVNNRRKTLPPISSLINHSCEELFFHLSRNGNCQMSTFITTTSIVSLLPVMTSDWECREYILAAYYTTTATFFAGILKRFQRPAVSALN